MLPALNLSERFLRATRRSHSRGKDYAFALGLQAAIFFLSSHLPSQEAGSFYSLLVIFSALFTALMSGPAAGRIAGVMASLNVDYHFIGPVGGVLDSWESFGLLFTTLSLVQITLAAVNILKSSWAQAETEAENARRSAKAREEILSIVAHDLRQPLSVISMRANLMIEQERMGFHSDIGKNLKDVLEDAGRLDRMIGDLLDFSRLDSQQLNLRPQTIDLGSLTLKIAEGFLTVNPKSITADIAPNLIARADADRVQQVLGNLISNGYKYGDASLGIHLSAVARGDFAVISVSNYGRGIPKAQLPHVFERFMRTDEARSSRVKGLGLGLFITRSLVEAQGGKIWVESKPGRETTFSFTLPLAPQQEQPNEAENLIPLSPSLKGIKLLVVDDIAPNVFVLRTFLEMAGAEVIAAHSAREALVHLETFRPHLLISDIEMPDEDGYELLRQVRELYANLPVIALTGHTEPEELRKIVAAGFSSYAAKPISFPGLRSEIQRLSKEGLSIAA